MEEIVLAILNNVVALIESAPDRMCLKVRGGKGGKDRYTMLSPALLQTLRDYWHSYHPRTWLFPNRSGTEPICATLAQRMYYAARDRAKLGHQGGIHTLRHYAEFRNMPSEVAAHVLELFSEASSRVRSRHIPWRHSDLRNASSWSSGR